MKMEELPPLPEPTLETNGDVFGHENVEGFTADQMRQYAMQAVLAERERAAGLIRATYEGYVPTAAPYKTAMRCARLVTREERVRWDLLTASEQAEIEAAAIRAQTDAT